MKPMIVRFPLVLVVSVLGACDSNGDDAAGGDAAPPADAALDGGGDCVGRRTATLGAVGGTLEHCGARVVVAPGAFAAPVELGIEPVSSPGEIFEPYTLNGRVLRFTPDDAPLPGPVDVYLPHDGTLERQEAARWTEEGWYVYEICEVDEATVSQTMSLLGTLAAVGDPTDYPEGPSGLGTGEVDFVFGDVSDSIAITTDGYAIYQDGQGGRAVTLLYRRSGEILEQLELRLWVADDGTAETLMVSHYSGATGEIWSADVLASPDAVAVELTEAGATLRGTAEGLLYLGEASRPISATFEGTPVLFRFPPERVCGFPKG